MKVIYVIGQLGKGGAEGQLYWLLHGLNREKYVPKVVSLSPGQSCEHNQSKGEYWAEKIRELDIELIQFPRRGHVDIWRLIRLIKVFRKIKPGIVHTYLHSANTYGRVAGIVARIPVMIASERSSYELGRDKSRFSIYIDKLLALFSTGIICNSYQTSQSLVKRYAFDETKIFTVHNGIKNDRFFQRTDEYEQKKTNSKRIGIVANLTRPKNYRVFLEASKCIHHEFKADHLEILIVGDGPLENDLKEYAQDLEIAEKIQFEGSRDDVPAFLQTLDVFVLSSDYEGLSNAIMEAMAAGVPCVVTKVGGNSELVIDGETGYLVPPNNPEALANKVLYLLNNERIAKEFGLKGRERICKDFSLDKMVSKTEMIYEKLVNVK